MLGRTGWCAVERHTRCSYRPGGPCHGGIVLTDGGTYTCECDCHHNDGTLNSELKVEQLELFAEVTT